MKILIVTAMYPTPENPAFGSFVRTQVEALKQAGIDVETLVLAGRFRKLIYPKGLFQLHQRLADRSIDLVHGHYGYCGMVARAQWQVPVVVTYHGDDLLGSVKNDRGQHTVPSKYIVAAGQRLSRMVAASIVQSEEMASKLRPQDRVYTIPHEVDFDLFHPIDRHQARHMLGLDPDKKYLLFAADPQIPVKRFSLAKAVAESLVQRGSRVELIVVYKETQDRLALYMNACDALVFPSFQEGSPNIVKQAMACNLPIVATDVGDVRQVIGKTSGCYICEPEVPAFVDKLQHILHLQRRTQGRDHIRHFDLSVITQKLIHVYETVLEQHPSRQMKKLITS